MLKKNAPPRWRRFGCLVGGGGSEPTPPPPREHVTPAPVSDFNPQNRAHLLLPTFDGNLCSGDHLDQPKGTMDGPASGKALDCCTPLDLRSARICCCTRACRSITANWFVFVAFISEMSVFRPPKPMWRSSVARSLMRSASHERPFVLNRYSSF